MKTILVTGAAGFVAEHLIPALRQDENRVIGLDRIEARLRTVTTLFVPI